MSALDTAITALRNIVQCDYLPTARTIAVDALVCLDKEEVQQAGKFERLGREVLGSQEYSYFELYGGDPERNGKVVASLTLDGSITLTDETAAFVHEVLEREGE